MSTLFRDPKHARMDALSVYFENLTGHRFEKNIGQKTRIEQSTPEEKA
jgi:hypothetical protein